MDPFSGGVCVVTGGGSGIGRELVVRLAGSGISVAACDLDREALDATAQRARDGAPAGVRVSTHHCDVVDEAQVLAFRDEALAEHGTDHLGGLVNNAGIGGGGSMLTSSRAEWERTFGICWGGVYLCTRVFLPLLVAAERGVIVNVSSVNGFWAALDHGIPHTAYSAAKFAVKGFTEALIVDLAENAPHVRVALVMPGHVATGIAANTRRVLNGADEISPADLDRTRRSLARAGRPADDASEEVLRRLVLLGEQRYRTRAPLSAGQAADQILTAVRAGRWRILVGEDAEQLDAVVRADPEGVYGSVTGSSRSAVVS